MGLQDGSYEFKMDKISSANTELIECNYFDQHTSKHTNIC